MKFLRVILTCALLVTGLRGDDADSYCGEVTASSLRLRAGPGEAYQDVVTLPQGARVVVVGRHANNPDWLQVEVPQGYHAWVFGRFLDKTGEGMGTFNADRVQIRPRPSTKFHQLAGIFMTGDKAKIVGEKVAEDGVWYQVVVPSSVPLYAHGRYLKNAGPASLALQAAKEAPAEAAPSVAEPTGDRTIREIEPRVTEAIRTQGKREEMEQLRRTLAEIDRETLSAEMRERRFELVAKLMDAEKRLAVAELRARETQLRGDLDRRLQDIERSYRKRLQEIREEFEKEQKPRYVATGLVMYRPDVLGRIPSYRLEEAGQMRYFLIAHAYDLGRFAGKRVGVTGLVDPESGTGYETIMVKRIEILGDE